MTRQFLLDDKPKGIINIVDATNIERNLYLTMQLMELDIPMVLALNMMDEVREETAARFASTRWRKHSVFRSFRFRGQKRGNQ